MSLEISKAKRIMSQPTKTISTESLQQEGHTFPPPQGTAQRAWINAGQYQQMYERSVKDADAFWLEQCNTLEWFKKPTVARKFTWDTAARKIEHTWFEDGATQLSASIVSTAISGPPIAPRRPSSGRAKARTKCKSSPSSNCIAKRASSPMFSRSLGIKKGDRVCIYMPMVPEAAVVMLACTRIGAIHSIVFGGFSADSLAGRINDSTCKLLITANAGVRGGKPILLKDISDNALKHTPTIEKVVVFKRNDTPCQITAGRDVWYHELMAQASAGLRSRRDERRG